MAMADEDHAPPSTHFAGPVHVYPHSHHGTPAQEYSSFSFQSPHLQMESSTFSTTPFHHSHSQQPHHHQQQRSLPQQLQPLMMPQWPSMLSSQSQASYLPSYPQQPPQQQQQQQPQQQQQQQSQHHVHQPIQPMQPIGVGSLPTPISATSTRSASTPRKTLTDLDRKRMCLYAEEHPNSKQTEIGAIFGVERSTVSKVLRQKEKYLHQDDGSHSPTKRPKGRSPDIDKTLAKWAIKQESKGLPLTDELIREKARYFAAATTTPDSQMPFSASWLEKFKLKNNLMGSRSRKASLATDDGQLRSDTSPLSSPRIAQSPSSDLHHAQSQENLKHSSPDSFIGFRHPFQSASTTSLSTTFTDTATSSFSPGPLSPTSPFFTPDSGTAPSPFMQLPASRPLQQAAAIVSANSHRPRSQTFPLLDQYMVTTAETMTPKYVDHTVLDSPMEERVDPMGRIDDVMRATEPVDRCSTVTPSESMRPPPLPTHYASVGMNREHSPHTSVEEVHSALDTVLNFLKHQPDGFLTLEESVQAGHIVGQLMEKLRLQHRSSISSA